MPAGSKLLIVMSSANHDESHFADADLVDIRRDNASDHLTFGYGSHQCMGKNLARMEMQVFLEEFTRRLPHMQLARADLQLRAQHVVPRARAPVGRVGSGAESGAQATRRCSSRAVPVRIGEPSQHAITRPWWSSASTPVAEGIVRLRLVAPDGQPLPRWTPGSHIDVECGDPDLSRQYSLCGDPAERDALEIAVLRETEGRGGSAWVHANVQAPATGSRSAARAITSASTKRPTGVIFIAGGIGITPISAMARRAKVARHGLRRCTTAAARRATMALLDELAALHGDRLRGLRERRGHAQRLRSDCSPRPSPARRSMPADRCACSRRSRPPAPHWPEDALHDRALRLDHRHARSHEGACVRSRAQGLGHHAQVGADQTVLDALRAANIDIQSDCEEGLCGSCEVRVLAGEVDHRDVVLTRAEREANTKMMTCCSRACGKKLVIEL